MPCRITIHEAWGLGVVVRTPITLRLCLSRFVLKEVGPLEDDVWLDYSTRSPMPGRKADLEIKEDSCLLE